MAGFRLTGAVFDLYGGRTTYCLQSTGPTASLNAPSSTGRYCFTSLTCRRSRGTATAAVTLHANRAQQACTFLVHQGALSLSDFQIHYAAEDAARVVAGRCPLSLDASSTATSLQASVPSSLFSLHLSTAKRWHWIRQSQHLMVGRL
jgi:hypothetical protein